MDVVKTISQMEFDRTLAAREREVTQLQTALDDSRAAFVIYPTSKAAENISELSELLELAREERDAILFMRGGK